MLAIVVTDGNHRMTAYDCFAISRHRHASAFGDVGGFKALVDGKPEDEGVSSSQTTTHLAQCLNDALIAHHLILSRVSIAFLGWLLRKSVDVVGPLGLRADPLLVDTLDTVPNLCAAIGADRPFDGPFVIVDKQAG